MDKPKKIFMTGASGFVGSRLCRILLETGHQVSTFGRSNVDIDPAYRDRHRHINGDITNQEEVFNALSDANGYDVVYHLAGFISYRKKDKDKQYAINVLGTRYIVEACLKYNVPRLIHTSSVAALGISSDGKPADESIEYNLKGKGLNYCDTKHNAELEVQKGVKAGLTAIILCPGIILGEGDSHPHHHAIFRSIAKGYLLGWPQGGVMLSDINDVLQVHINAMTMGRSGERYIIGGSNHTFKEAAEITAKIFGSKPPKFPIPDIFLTIAGTLSEQIMPLLGKKPALTKQIAYLAQQKIFFSFEKAKKELNLIPTPFEETIKRTAPYYLAQI